MPPQRDTTSSDAKWSRACFRAWSEEMPPEAIIDALGLQPTKFHRKGDVRYARARTFYKEHCIFIESTLSTFEPLQSHLAALCELLEPISSKLAVIEGRCGYDIFCGFSSGNGQGGFTLSTDLLRRLAALRLPLVVDLHPPQR